MNPLARNACSRQSTVTRRRLRGGPGGRHTVYGARAMSPVDDLVALLALEPIEVNIFRGRSPDDERRRVFGGKGAGKALVAPSRPVDEPQRHVHSLHAYFLRPG